MTIPANLDEQIDACIKDCKAMDAPLGERLSSMAGEVRRLVPDFASAIDHLVERLHKSGAGGGAPAVGEVMPSFVLPNENGHLVNLSGITKHGRTVIAFHRGHWCPYCEIEADALARIDPEIRKAGAQLVVITPETQKYAKQFKQMTNARFPILTDLDCGYALELRLAIKITDEARLAMKSCGWDISGFNDNENWILPIPATFVLDTDGIIISRFVDPDYRKRMEIEDLLTALRARAEVSPAA
jgi:peroxiredoxin